MIVHSIRHGCYPKLSSFKTGFLKQPLSSTFQIPHQFQDFHTERAQKQSIYASLKIQSNAKNKEQKLHQISSSTVNYLINSCGLSPESAILASQKVQFQNLVKPESVLALLSRFGFSKTQISNTVRKRPLLLVADPVNTLLPKLDFIHSIGISKSDLARTLSADPTILTRSLENQIIPSYNFLKTVLLTDQKIVCALKRTTWIFFEHPSKNLIPNMDLLSELGVPQTCIRLLLAHFPEALLQKHEIFSKVVNEVKEMGFDVKKSTFVLAVHALSGKGNKSTWEKCHEVYKRWGWSEDTITGAFRKHPHSMMLSEKKIMKAMDYLVNEMGWESQAIAKFPASLFFSLEKRIAPRCRVIRVLWAKGSVKESLSLASILVPTEKVFVQRFIDKHGKEIPQLLDVYKGKVDPEEV